MAFHEHLQTHTAAERAALLRIPILQDALRGDIRLGAYVAFLTEAYHHVRHTAALLMACGSRLPQRASWLRAAIAQYIEEEIGHDEWILADLAECGADAEAIRAGEPAFETDLMVAYAYHQIDRCNPIGFFGMVHVLEGTSIAIATDAAHAIRARLGLPARAFTYLTSHGSLDLQHVKLFEELMNRVTDAGDQTAIVRCARAFYRLYGDIFRSLPHDSRRAA
jgi:pyrroloquinoline quinone (PQQ) biosynthesis protein C